MNPYLRAENIEKEEVSKLTFLKTKAENQQPDTIDNIQKATQLGNSLKGKVIIVFQADQGLFKVNTTIWASGTKFICLKGGVWIPISNIEEILF
jgi:hypothetical protein